MTTNKSAGGVEGCQGGGGAGWTNGLAYNDKSLAQINFCFCFIKGNSQPGDFETFERLKFGDRGGKSEGQRVKAIDASHRCETWHGA